MYVLLKKKMRILVFGNPYLEEDSKAVRIAKKLEKKLKETEFKITAEINDLLGEEYDAIMDVAYGIKETTIINETEKLKKHKLISLHDYDVGFFLKLLKELGKLEKKPIIAIPITGEEEKTTKETEEIIKKITKKTMKKQEEKEQE